MPMYQRTSPINSTIAEVKNINGNRSIKRIAAVDQQVLDAVHRAAVEQEVRARHAHEQEQRRLDDSGEDTGLPDHQHGGDAPDGVGASKDGVELLAAGTGVEGEADRGEGDRDQHRSPRRNTRHRWGSWSDARPPPQTARAVLTHVDRTGFGWKWLPAHAGVAEGVS